jgi:hypothetical protein
VVAELIAAPLQQGFAPGAGPELLAAFDALVDSLDGRLDLAGGDRQAHAAVHPVLHA